MIVDFTKMHGLGNDFVVMDATRQPIELSESQIRFIADRRFGIGCDQVLMVAPPRSADTDFYYRIFNADGSEVEQCGNGARCFARFVHEKGLSDKESFRVGTHGGDITLYLEGDNQVRVNMGVPELRPEQIPFLADGQSDSYRIEVDGQTLQIGAVSMGNPHAVLQAPLIDEAPVEQLGPLLESHPRFPQRVNVGFMAIRDRGHIDLRVFERGAGETLACGSGACAAMVVGRLQGLLDPRVRVSLPGGNLVISWETISDPVWMSGPAVSVFQGRIEI